MKSLILVSISCNKIINELVYKNKIVNDFWQHIEEDKELKEFLDKEENKGIDLDTKQNEEGEIALTLASKFNSI